MNDSLTGSIKKHGEVIAMTTFCCKYIPFIFNNLENVILSQHFQLSYEVCSLQNMKPC